MLTKEREPVASLVLYHCLKWPVVNPIFRVYFQGKIYGGEKVPQKGVFIVASNHASNFDPPIVSCCVRRPVAFMAKEELFNIPVLKQAIQLYGAYPVKRTASDRSAIQSAIQSLQSGWLTGIFLGGTRTSDGQITDPKLGAALIAAKAQVPLLPLSLWGTEKIFTSGSKRPKPVPITVRIGDLIAPPRSTKREELTAVTAKCATIINDLHQLGR